MIFIYRAIESGMVSLVDVTSGRVSLADIVGVNHYLDMRSDIEYMVNEKETQKARLRR